MLSDITSLVRSKNAGPFLLTLDIIFRDRESYELVVRSGVLSAASIAQMYGAAETDVEFFLCPEIHAIKATLPRAVGSGDPLDTDVYGAQQVGPLMNLEFSTPSIDVARQNSV
jgi:hypothetical protein